MRGKFPTSSPASQKITRIPRKYWCSETGSAHRHLTFITLGGSATIESFFALVWHMANQPYFDPTGQFSLNRLLYAGIALDVGDLTCPLERPVA